MARRQVSVLRQVRPLKKMIAVAYLPSLNFGGSKIRRSGPNLGGDSQSQAGPTQASPLRSSPHMVNLWATPLTGTSWEMAVTWTNTKVVPSWSSIRCQYPSLITPQYFSKSWTVMRAPNSPL